MRRRAVLRGAVGLAGVAGVAGATAGEGGRGAGPYAPLGHVEIEGAAEAVVGDDGTTAYVATLDGFAAVDVSDPAAPAVLAERTDLLADRENGPMRNVQDLSVDGDRLAVAGPANDVTGDPPEALVVFDVSDPTAPAAVAVHDVDHSIHNCFLEGRFAYLTAGEKLEVVDLGGDAPATASVWGPTSHEPEWASVAERNRIVHDVYVHDGRAYLACWDAGTFVLDVSDPTAPSYLGRVADYTLAEAADLGEWAHVVPPGNHHYARVSDDGSLLAVGREAWAFDEADVDGGPGGITLYDVSTPAAPAELATVDPVRARSEGFVDGYWTTAHNFDIVDGRLYSSWYQAGVKIHDVSDPSNPELLAWWRRPETAAFWTAQRAAGAVVASSHAIRSLREGFEGLFAFPDRAGEQADPPTIPSPTPTPTPTATPDATTTATDSPARTDTSSPTPTPTTGDGFGGLAALAALGGAAWWRRRG